MLVKFRGKGRGENTLPPRSVEVEVEGVKRVLSADIHVDWDKGTPVTAMMEVLVGDVDLSAEGVMFTEIEGKRYQLVEVEK